MKFICERCHYETDRSTNLKKHLNRINICDPKYSKKTTTELLNKLKKHTDYECDNCNKGFSHSSSLYRHKKDCLTDKEKIDFLLEKVKSLEIQQEKLNKINNEMKQKLSKTEGYIYIMQSKVHPTFFKIGRTTDLKEREKSLMKDNTYKTYQLKIIKHYLVNDYFQKEKELHDKFLQFRYCKTNGYNCDTELFIINDKENFITNFEEMFKTEN
jgi:hypothetical protein